jgi:hypothetical protein
VGGYLRPLAASSTLFASQLDPGRAIEDLEQIAARCYLSEVVAPIAVTGTPGTASTVRPEVEPRHSGFQMSFSITNRNDLKYEDAFAASDVTLRTSRRRRQSADMHRRLAEETVMYSTIETTA